MKNLGRAGGCYNQAKDVGAVSETWLQDAREEIALPVHEISFVFVPILGKQDEGGSAGDEGGIDIQFEGYFIASLAQCCEALLLGQGGLVEDVGALGGKVRFRDVLGVRDSDQNSFAAARAETGRENALKVFNAFRFVSHAEKEIVVENKKGRFVGGDGFFFAPLPKFAEDSKASRVEAIAAFHAPLVAIGRGHISAIDDEVLAGFLLPIEAAFFL